MSPAYISAIIKNLPNAKIVFDHFHVIKMFNEKLSELRRQLYHEVNDILQKKVMKGTRWLLLKNPENLDHRDEYRRLREALELLWLPPSMKEDLRQWKQTNKMTQWRKHVPAVPTFMKQLANTLARSGLLNTTITLSTGPLEY